MRCSRPAGPVAERLHRGGDAAPQCAHHAEVGGRDHDQQQRDQLDEEEREEVERVLAHVAVEAERHVAPAQVRLEDLLVALPVVAPPGDAGQHGVAGGEAEALGRHDAPPADGQVDTAGRRVRGDPQAPRQRVERRGRAVAAGGRLEGRPGRVGDELRLHLQPRAHQPLDVGGEHLLDGGQRHHGAAGAGGARAEPPVAAEGDEPALGQRVGPAGQGALAGDRLAVRAPAVVPQPEPGPAFVRGRHRQQRPAARRRRRPRDLERRPQVGAGPLDQPGGEERALGTHAEQRRERPHQGEQQQGNHAAEDEQQGEAAADAPDAQAPGADQPGQGEHDVEAGQPAGPGHEARELEARLARLGAAARHGEERQQRHEERPEDGPARRAAAAVLRPAPAGEHRERDQQRHAGGLFAGAEGEHAEEAERHDPEQVAPAQAAEGQGGQRAPQGHRRQRGEQDRQAGRRRRQRGRDAFERHQRGEGGGPDRQRPAGPAVVAAAQAQADHDGEERAGQGER